MKLCPKIILEGTRLTHKSNIAFALNDHPHIVGLRKYRYHSSLISAEWCGFSNYQWRRALINFDAQEVIQRFVEAPTLQILRVDISADNVMGEVERVAN
jgi:hypothetical protein